MRQYTRRKAKGFVIHMPHVRCPNCNYVIEVTIRHPFMKVFPIKPGPGFEKEEEGTVAESRGGNISQSSSSKDFLDRALGKAEELGL